ncbi:hypothetical protein [Clostridium sp. FP1]|uniref:hypothetical protein n=1 Tax=Clostridium sp. FP1 TaxID=2724076 RepID=UPI0013E98201|nr:hypothetical protein [Clostridium sp. FP1]MBZ9635512.1 hypothetical protein [Clostridium sp. FP1]
MAEEIKVIPTPIQRNFNDVAMELTMLFYSKRNNNEYTVQKIQEAYRKFYATAQLMANMPYDELDNV